MSGDHNSLPPTRGEGQGQTDKWEDVADEVLAAIEPKVAVCAKRLTDGLYDGLLSAVQDYLVANARFNISSTLDVAERGRRSEWERAEAAEAKLSALAGVVEAARDLVMKPGGLVNRGVGVGLVVVEKADKSDPHYRLCTAFERLDALPHEGVAIKPAADGEASKPKARATEPKSSTPSNHTEESKP